MKFIGPSLNEPIQSHTTLNLQLWTLMCFEASLIADVDYGHPRNPPCASKCFASPTSRSICWPLFTRRDTTRRMKFRRVCRRPSKLEVCCPADTNTYKVNKRSAFINAGESSPRQSDFRPATQNPDTLKRIRVPPSRKNDIEGIGSRISYEHDGNHCS